MQVVFHLHHSFTDPVREVTTQPFELTETGWGEFDIQIAVHFVDEAMEEPFEIQHLLKLFHANETPNSTKRPVVSETYEELVFSEPTEAMYTKIAPVLKSKVPPAPESQLTPHLPLHSDADEFRRIVEAREKVSQMIMREKAKML